MEQITWREWNRAQWVTIFQDAGVPYNYIGHLADMCDQQCVDSTILDLERARTEYWEKLGALVGYSAGIAREDARRVIRHDITPPMKKDWGVDGKQ